MNLIKDKTVQRQVALPDKYVLRLEIPDSGARNDQRVVNMRHIALGKVYLDKIVLYLPVLPK